MSSETTKELTRDLFREEYTPEFADKWDELINWRSRRRSEGGFFQRVLEQHGAKKVLDVACGTGFHTVTLTLDGFDVTGADGSTNMLAKAKENAKRFGLEEIPFVEANWLTLSKSFEEGAYDAIVCLGNAFTHLFEDKDRRKALSEIHKVLKKGGIAVIDHRNYDKILDKGYHSKHSAYYLGESVTVYPEEVTDDYVKFKYNYDDGSSYHLTLCPIRQDYVSNLLKDAGFKNIERYGDFEDEYNFYEPDFIIQVATK